MNVDMFDAESGTLVVAPGATVVSGYSMRNDIIKVVFPQSITEISDNAFCQCASLQTVQFAD